MGLPLWTWIGKTIHGGEILTLREPASPVTKVYGDGFLEMKEPITIDFIEKGATVPSYWQLLKRNSFFQVIYLKKNIFSY